MSLETKVLLISIGEYIRDVRPDAKKMFEYISKLAKADGTNLDPLEEKESGS